jgi:hypothetical protein
VEGDKNAVNTHTLRVGYITQAVMAGHPIWQIKRVSPQKSDVVVAGSIKPINKRKAPSLL